MGKYAGYLIASDLDGTLINSEQCISGKNIDAIASFVKEGGLFAIATGRTEITAMPFMKQISINCPCILYNGAAIYDMKSNSHIKAELVDKKYLLEPLRGVMEKFKDSCIHVYVKGKTYIVSGEENIDPVVLKEDQPFEVKCIDEVINEDWIKVLINDDNQTLQRIHQFLNGKLSTDTIHSVFSAPTYLELFSKGVTKGSALEHLMKITNVNRDKVITIGDYCNDIEMIKASGLGVATSNAHPLLKEAAKLITVNNNEHALHNLINKVLPIYASILEKGGVVNIDSVQEEYIKIPV